MWDALLDGTFAVVQFFYNICGDWGLSIIIITVIFRMILFPLMYRQARSNFNMQKIQPKMKEIQEKFADDRQRQSEEMQKLYSEAHFNPISGCLPMILQIPIFMLLFQTLRGLGDREEVVNYSFYGIVPDLVKTPEEAFGEGIGTFVPYLVLMIIFAGATFLPMIIQQLRNQNRQGGAQRNTTLIMGIVMTVFMLFISWGSPAGVLLYWGTSSLLGVAQNQWSLHHFRVRDAKRIEEEEEAGVVNVEPVSVNVKRKERKPRPTKKK